MTWSQLPSAQKCPTEALFETKQKFINLKQSSRIMELSIFEYANNHQTYIFVQGCSRYEKQASATSKPNPLGSACNLKKKTPPTFTAKAPPAKGRKKMHRLRGFFSEFSSTSKQPKKTTDSTIPHGTKKVKREHHDLESCPQSPSHTVQLDAIRHVLAKKWIWISFTWFGRFGDGFQFLFFCGPPPSWWKILQ